MLTDADRNEIKKLIEQEVRKQLQEQADFVSEEMNKTFRMLLKSNFPE